MSDAVHETLANVPPDKTYQAVEGAVASAAMFGAAERRVDLFRTLGEDGHKFFETPEYANVYKAAYKFFALGIDPTANQIVLGLRKANPDKDLVWVSELSSYRDKYISSDYAWWARELKTQKLKRQLAVKSSTFAASLNNGHTAEQIAQLAEDLQRDAKILTESSTLDMPALLAEFEQQVREHIEHGAPAGPKLGFWQLDNAIGALEPGLFIVVAARPSVGKSAFALNVAYRCIYEGKSVFVFSMEMIRKQIFGRMMAITHEVDMRALKRGQKSELDRLTAARQWLSDKPFYVDDASSPRLTYVMAQLRTHIERFGRPDLVILDYLQLMSGYGKHDNRQSEVSQLSRTIKTFAKEVEAPFLVLAQLSREADGVEPQKTHLRESGAIEQDADIILMLWPDKDNPDAIVNCKVDKNRDGPSGVYMKIAFTKKTQRMVAMEPNGQPADFKTLDGSADEEQEEMF